MTHSGDPNIFAPAADSEDKQAGLHVEQEGVRADISPDRSNVAESLSRFTLETDKDLAGFRTIEVTKKDESKPWKPPLEVAIVTADGRRIEGVDADTAIFTFKPKSGEGLDLTVSAATAGHIDSLHFKAVEPGSRFSYPSLEELFKDVARKLPEGVAKEPGRSAFDMDMGKSMGEEGIASAEELVKGGVISAKDFMGMQGVKDQVFKLNKGGTAEEKEAFVANYKSQYPDSKIQFQLLRGTVILPAAEVPKRETTKLFMAFGPDNKGGKTLYTAAPGRNMPRHPNPDQHKDPAGIIDEKTFEESSEAWFNTIMLTGKNEAKESNLQKPEQIKFDKKNYTLLLGIDGKNLESQALQEMASSRGLQGKPEFHITVLGFRAGKMIKDTLKPLPPEARAAKEAEIEQLVQSTDWSFTAESQDKLHIQKEYSDPKQADKKEKREAIIQILHLPGMQSFYERLNQLLGASLEAPPAHTTLYTGGSNPETSKMGIGIDTPAALEELHPDKIKA